METQQVESEKRGRERSVALPDSSMQAVSRSTYEGIRSRLMSAGGAPLRPGPGILTRPHRASEPLPPSPAARHDAAEGGGRHDGGRLTCEVVRALSEPIPRGSCP